MIGCLIVARLSSKRLPNKNVLLFNEAIIDPHLS